MIKRLALRVFFILEIVGFTYVYLFGPQGVHALQQLQQENDIIEQDIDALHIDIAKLETDMQTWEHDDFYKEKIAREQLQMARPDDEIYYLTETE